MCETRVKDTILLISDCAMAPKMPTSIVSPAAMSSGTRREDSANSRVSVRMIA